MIQPQDSRSSHLPNCVADLSLIHPSTDAALFISHELRTPLTSIQGVLGLLRTGQLGSLTEEGQRLLAIAINNANRLTRLASAIEQEQILPLTVLSTDEIEQLQLENELHQALEQQQFHLVYQPIVSVQQQRIVGFEALVRWRHPTKGNISPMVFIPLAEQNGIIYQLGLWVLEQACQQLKVWQKKFSVAMPLSMSVNVSGLQLLQPNLLQDVERVLTESNIAPGSLKLEITETVLIENQQAAIAVLSKLREMGVQFYIDDFGTGYSSLARLQDLPIDAVKIDRSFVCCKRWDISETILSLADRLGLGVIAEGVETIDDLQKLQALGCQLMQGYLFSQPVNPEAIESYLQSSQGTLIASPLLLSEG